MHLAISPNCPGETPHLLGRDSPLSWSWIRSELNFLYDKKFKLTYIYGINITWNMQSFIYLAPSPPRK